LLIYRKDAPVTALIAQRTSYVAGQWLAGGDAFAVHSPADETLVADVSSAPLAHVERAITRARDSFDSGVWADLPAAGRARVLRAFLDRLLAAHDDLVATMVAEAGQPVFFADGLQFGAGLKLGRDTIDLYLSLPHEDLNPVPVDELTRNGLGLSVRRYEPAGVVAAITPYNAAFIMAMQKVIPALMAGNSVILRPSRLLLRAHRARPARQRQPGGSRGDLRAGDRDHRLP
jgi:acyl-CoA reductase-like NAD-dependent aldehyde dehydrogenase